MQKIYRNWHTSFAIGDIIYQPCSPTPLMWYTETIIFENCDELEAKRHEVTFCSHFSLMALNASSAYIYDPYEW